MHVTINRRPIGEAPEWVRDAWIGLSLPVVEPRQRNLPTLGVLTGPHSVLKQLWAMCMGRTKRMAGYIVDAKTAVDILENANPAAAEWWKCHAPTLLDGKRRFVFDVEATSSQIG